MQIEVPGRLGPDDGRYLVRDDAGNPAEVAVLATLGAERARGRLRRGRPVAVTNPGAAPIPVTRVTVVGPEPFENRAGAMRWLEKRCADTERTDELVDRTLRTLNRLLHAHRVATQDPYVPDLAQHAAGVLRLGIGTGDQLADGHWTRAVELPASRAERRRARVEDIRPQERIAAVLAGREQVEPCESLMLRARADFDQGRERDGALQLAAALEALLAELGGDSEPAAGTDQRRDLDALVAQRDAARAAAKRALAGEPGESAIEGLHDTLRLGERLLRRRRLLG